MPATVRWWRSNVCTRRVSVPVRSSSANSSDSASGPSPTSGPSSPGASTHHPALRSVPNSLTSTDGRSSNRRRTTPTLGRVALGGSSRSTRPALGQVQHDPRPPLELEQHELPPPPDALEPDPDQRLRRHRERLQRRELQRRRRLQRRPGHRLRQPLGQRLHLGKLGHRHHGRTHRRAKVTAGAR